jgi:hypothetical protein
MESVDLATLKGLLDHDLETGTVSGRAVLDRFRVIDEESRKTAAYLDHRYAPFYYHLGKRIRPKSLMEIGFTLGLLAGPFFVSCKTVERFVGFKEPSKDFLPTRLGKANIRQVFKGQAEYCVGNLYDSEFAHIFSPNSWDCIILNDETVYDKHLEYLDAVWPCLSEGGLIVAEYIDRHAPAGDAFLAFCESKNRRPQVFATRYGTGIVQK